MPTLAFIEDDNPRSLFPLQSNLLYASHGEAEIQTYLTDKVLNKKEPDAFMSVPVGYALKDSLHVRKLLLLDPIASYYMYDVIWRNSASFQTARPSDRMHFGYAFKNKKPLPPADQYHAFRRHKYDLKRKYKYFAKFDISNCFNSFYHHNLSDYVHTHLPIGDADGIGQFLREIVKGTSINCFPQGIYPAKTLGNYYLSFIETSMELRSPAIIRFLDDIFLFSNRHQTLERDAVVLQQLLGSHSLSLNPDKTCFGSRLDDFDERVLDNTKKVLLKKREKLIGYDDDDDDEDSESDLDEQEREYLHALARTKHVEEEDVELALSLIDDSEVFVELAQLVCSQFPNLIKHVHRLCGHDDLFGSGEAIWDVINARIGKSFLTEFELFWLAKIIIDYYELNATAVAGLVRIHSHDCSTGIVKAVIVECGHNGHGLLEMKDRQLRDSPGSLTAMCALAGLRDVVKSKRNQICKYVAKSGAYSSVLAGIVSSMP